MKKLVDSLKELRKSKVKKQVDSRIKEFKTAGKKSSNEIFKELCFCILTANSTAEQCIKVHEKVGDGFLNLNRTKLQKKLQQYGCRFHNKRAGYIAEAQKYKNTIKKIIQSKTSYDARDWLASNIKGLGMKESSHFLRNIGYDDLAIVDFHIVDILADNGLAERPKTMTRNSYLEIEETLSKLAKKTNLTLSELDLYLWCMETGKVLK